MDPVFLVVSAPGTTLEGLERYLYSGSTVVRSYELRQATRPVLVAVIQAESFRLADQLSNRLGSGLITTWTVIHDLDTALAETVVVRASLGLTEPVVEVPAVDDVEPGAEQREALAAAATRVRILLRSARAGSELGPLSELELDALELLAAYAEGPAVEPPF